MSDFKFSCPSCGSVLEVPVAEAGMLADCPDCDTEITIPQPQQRRRRKMKASGRRRRPGPGQPQGRGGDAPRAQAEGPGNMHLVDDKVTTIVRQYLRDDEPESLITGWTGLGLFLSILLNRFEKLFRKYYYIVITERGVVFMLTAGILKIKIKSCRLIPWNQIQAASFKDGLLNTYFELTVNGKKTRYKDVESSLLHPFVANLQAYGVIVTKR